MQSCGLNMFSGDLFNNMRIPTESNQSSQELLLLASNLQSIVLKQQVMLNVLLMKQKQLEDELKLTFKAPEDDLKLVKTESNETDISVENIVEKIENLEDDKFANMSQGNAQIIRRNGFKPLNQVISPNEEENDSSSDSDNSCKKKRNPSQAKHLWVNYGRRIIDYALSQTNGEMQEKIKLLTGKLNSKKDFESVFKVNSADSEEENLFKVTVGKLAISFIKYKAAPSFEGSKYRDQMVNQRHVVAAWIEKLICE